MKFPIIVAETGQKVLLLIGNPTLGKIWWDRQKQYFMTTFIMNFIWEIPIVCFFKARAWYFCIVRIAQWNLLILLLSMKWLPSWTISIHKNCVKVDSVAMYLEIKWIQFSQTTFWNRRIFKRSYYYFKNCFIELKNPFHIKLCNMHRDITQRDQTFRRLIIT